ncbi:3-oxoacyl-(acyl-carrier-protein) reductase [Cellulophaga algicola DSM 14237]|uniref:3-oxoacyl-(Acyl-carrier-protein) reductase n=1 Tax=Cellulophaga algicola (strain DSM 14237 / IC166 / ACAM 630) TaxID=688270 RepID=E6XD72_CELAD|nr:SDR family oxidoreductase [Cellulophaga algicola]ADV47985.1 3-oxoacyl-(acyl-carrier-protein) reductase [Cellulophaga algicola DSM 14237]
MNISLKGKKAFVGGSSDGIGKAIAKQLAASGASVTLVSRSEAKLKDIIAELPTTEGQTHQYLLVDYTNFEDYALQLEAYLKSNTIDILVNNTQGPSAGNTLEKNISDYQHAFDLLFKTTVFTTELALKNMIKNKWGRIINIASVSVKEPLSYLALSNTIRAAVVTWGKSLATDVGPYQITVNNILTGYFDTNRIAQLNATKAKQLGISETEVRNQMEDKVSLKRIGNPKEYGYLVTFLASANAAYITGTSIPIDGGLLKSL